MDGESRAHARPPGISNDLPSRFEARRQALVLTLATTRSCFVVEKLA
jgi:hypothetical protein